MKRFILFFIFMLGQVLLGSFEVNASTFILNHNSNNYSSVFRAISAVGANQPLGADCDLGVTNPCQDGLRCQVLPNDSETERLYPGLYKRNCLFRRTCSGTQKSPRTLCQDRCQQNRNSTRAAIANCNNACLVLDPKCSFVDLCVHTNQENGTEPVCSHDPISAATASASVSYLGFQHQECDSNRCVASGIQTPAAYCVPRTKCISICAEEGELITASRSCCAGYIRGADNRCHSPDYIETVPSAIIPEVNFGGTCQPHFYESTNGVKNPDEAIVNLRQTAYERFLLGFEFVAANATNINDYFGINQEVIRVAQAHKNARASIQARDNADLKLIDSFAASLTHVASGLSFYKLLYEENRILRDTDRLKARMYMDLITPMTNLMTYNSTRQWNKFTNANHWIDISCSFSSGCRVRLADSICGKYIFPNKYCVKNCWEAVDRKIVDPLIPNGMTQLNNQNQGNANYQLILGAVGLGTGAGFVDASRFTTQAIQLALNNNVVAGLSLAASGISPSLGGGFLLSFLNKFSRPRYLTTSNFNSTAGMKQLQDAFIYSFSDYAMGRLPSARSASETMVSSIASEFELRMHIAEVLFQKNLAILSAQEKSEVDIKVTELKKMINICLFGVA